MSTAVQSPSAALPSRENTLLRVLVVVSVCHLLNDMVQSLLPSVYPILKGNFHLSFGQIGMIAFVNQVTASLLQPFVGLYTDKHPAPYSLPAGMTISLLGVLLLAFGPDYAWLLLGASLVGVGSAVFHPECSRVARMASGGQHGFAQSFFQVGGNTGTAIGPLLAALIVLPHGQHGMAWFAIVAVMGIVLLAWVGKWSRNRHSHPSLSRTEAAAAEGPSRAKVTVALVVLLTLIFSKFFYLASLTSYYTFYLMTRFHVSVRSSQLHLFAFLAAVAAGVMLGGPIGDRIRRKRVIWASILGVLPFSLAMAYANLFWTGILSVIIGFVISSAFPAIVVYGQELLPGRVGMVSGLFFGLAFGMGGIGAAVLGKLADMTSIVFVYHVCAWLPALGLFTWLLPDVETHGKPMLCELTNAQGVD